MKHQYYNNSLSEVMDTGKSRAWGLQVRTPFIFRAIPWSVTPVGTKCPIILPMYCARRNENELSIFRRPQRFKMHRLQRQFSYVFLQPAFTELYKAEARVTCKMQIKKFHNFYDFTCNHGLAVQLLRSSLSPIPSTQNAFSVSTIN